MPQVFSDRERLDEVAREPDSEDGDPAEDEHDKEPSLGWSAFE